MLNEKNITRLLAVFFVVLTLGFLIHQSPTFAGSLIGHAIGIVGTLIIFMTLIYPYRKRVLKRRGKRNPLKTHIYYGLIGPSLVVIHSAHKFSSLIGVLCFMSMLLVVLSGIVGKFLFRRVNRTLKQQRSDLDLLRKLFERRRNEISLFHVPAGTQGTKLEQGYEEQAMEDEQMELARQKREQELVNLAHSIAETEDVITVFSGTKTLFSRWVRVHYFLTMFLVATIIVHVLTTIYYGIRWF